MTMIKTIQILFLFVHLLLVQLSEAQKVTISLNETGKPEYKKLFKSNEILPIYEGELNSYFKIPKNYLYTIGASGNGLMCNLIKSENNLGYIIETSSTSLKSEYKNSFLTIYSGNKSLSYEVTFQKKKENDFYKHSDDKSDDNIDSTLGFVQLQNRFCRYSNLNHFQLKGYNIALMDKGLNGKIELGDLLTISLDQYFATGECRSAIKLDTVSYIKLGNTNLKVTWDSGYALTLEEVDINGEPQLTVGGYLEDLKLVKPNWKLSDFTVKKGYYIINIWSEFSPSSLDKMAELNTIKTGLSDFI